MTSLSFGRTPIERFDDLLPLSSCFRHSKQLVPAILLARPKLDALGKNIREQRGILRHVFDLNCAEILETFSDINRTAFKTLEYLTRKLLLGTVNR